MNMIKEHTTLKWLAAAARKLLAAEGKKLASEGAEIGEVDGGKAGEAAGAEEGEKAGGSEAERLGAEEGERIGREIAGDEGQFDSHYWMTFLFQGTFRLHEQITVGNIILSILGDKAHQIYRWAV